MSAQESDISISMLIAAFNDSAPVDGAASQDDVQRREREFDRLLLQLPHWGEVVSWQGERGFGFLHSEGLPDQIFFHIHARQPKRSQKESRGRAEPCVGDRVLFAYATEPRRPDRPCAVRWASLTEWPRVDGVDLPTSQDSLDSLRQQALAALPTRELIKLMHAEWYAKLWKDESAPDRLRDSLRDSAFFDRLATLDYSALDGLPMPSLGWMRRPGARAYRPKLLLWHLLKRRGDISHHWAQWLRGCLQIQVVSLRISIRASVSHTQASEIRGRRS